MEDELTLKAAEDARLLDAARDMLEALETVKATLPHIGGNAMSVFSLMRQIDTAIAKAEGKQ